MKGAYLIMAMIIRTVFALLIILAAILSVLISYLIVLPVYPFIKTKRKCWNK
ncbi:hypothetical protein [Mucilaginibacter ginsenosidivorans]|uniref:hypothetical protein n=1 Tax=Mucilaginibacter ginsenosidivorans TaxID=398053 RepID=UPI0016529F0C|nr:hypothetical protein [Mucilaginibacter ginsenosidivorans]